MLASRHDLWDMLDEMPTDERPGQNADMGQGRGIGAQRGEKTTGRYGNGVDSPGYFGLGVFIHV
jgi:hypothetical protein